MKAVSTILIVDDDRRARSTLEALLLREGYQLEFACSGEEALEKAQTLIPSLILLDVMMPEMDGFEVCQRFRSMPVLAEVPIIMVTALDDRDSRLRGIEAGADDFIPKPFDSTELRARVRTITRLDRYRRLHLERTKFEWVIQQADHGYIILNDQDDILYANSHARLYLDIPPDYQGEPADDGNGFSLGRFLELARKCYRLEPEEAWERWPEQAVAGIMPVRYLVRPESSTADAFWLQVDILDLPSHSGMGKVIRLYDVTTQIISQRNKRGFHTMLYHKLRTPLVGILGSLEFLAHHVIKLSGEEVTQFAEMAFKSARRLHGEIEDILQYLNASSVMKTGEGMSIIQLGTSITQVCADLEVHLASLSIQDDLQQASLVLSSQAVELILWEVVENAKKFHPQQTPKIEVGLARSGSSAVSVQVQDDGVTLSPAQLSQMWMPYYQGEKYSTGEARGMGLGLATVAMLLWEANGRCHAYNRKDATGIVVELIIPLSVPLKAS